MKVTVQLALEYSIVDHSGKSTKLTPPASFQSPCYFVDYTNLQDGLATIYLSSSGPDESTSQLSVRLAKCVAQILHLPEISMNSPGLGTVLSCGSPREIVPLLAGLGELCGRCGTCSSEVCSRFFCSPHLFSFLFPLATFLTTTNVTKLG